MTAARIKIYKRQNEVVHGRTEEGEPILHHKCWCDIGSLYGAELYKAMEIHLENTIIFEVRYCKAVREMYGHLKDYFIKFEDDVYELYAIDRRRDRKQYVQLKAHCIT